MLFNLIDIKNNNYIPQGVVAAVKEVRTRTGEHIAKKYKNLNERIYKCKNTIDRDLNASINIMFEGLKLYMKKVII